MIKAKLQKAIRDIPDFPKPGILFKDITPIFNNPALCTEIVEAFVERLQEIEIDVVAGIESRGFLFGLMLANRLNIPFVPIRKAGKLPYKTVREEYDLEYGSAAIEMHLDALKPGQRVLIHDDLLATGGTALAATKLIEQLGGRVSAYCFIVNLDFLPGRKKLDQSDAQMVSLVSF